MSDDTDADPVEGGAADDADAEAGAEDADADESGGDGLAEGDFVRLAYTARTVEEGNLVDTTDAEAAEEADVDTEDQEFSPRVLALGSGQLFESVEDDIVGREVGEEGTVVVPADEAFGEYDPEDVRTVSVDRLPEDDRYPGAHVDIDGDHGHVQTIVGSRARVDFNHPLAGDDIEYEYEILGRVEDRVEQAQGMLQTYVDADLEMHIETEEVEEEVPVEEEGEEDEDGDEDAEPATETELREVETLYIESTPQLQFNQQWMFSKQQVAQQIIDRLGIDRVVIQETIEAQPSPMGGMGGMMGGGDVDLGDLEEAIDESDADAEEVLDELDVDEEAVEGADEAADDGDADAEE